MPKKTVIKLCIFIFVLGVIVGITSLAIAESINSDEVLYDNSNSSSNKENVQDALDNLYNIVDIIGSGYALVANNTTGLSTQLVGGLYRYQGVQDANNTVDNYICFGTTNKSDCVSDTDKYMYRIIGINELGQMKLIKKEALNRSYPSTYSWTSSNLYAAINGSDFLTDTTYVLDSTWSNRIAVSDWHVYTSTDSNISTIIARELSADTISAKIGLMYLHDYAYSLSNPEYTKTSWIHLSKNDSGAPSPDEWALTYYDNYGLWAIYRTGSVNNRNNFNTGFSLSVRPVFFLRTSETIASGNGTITDPYILG